VPHTLRWRRAAVSAAPVDSEPCTNDTCCVPHVVYAYNHKAYCHLQIKALALGRESSLSRSPLTAPGGKNAYTRASITSQRRRRLTARR
jgi:hypothetical protein